MKVIGVIDLFGGKAVHAQGGVRAHYQPVRQVAGVDANDGDALAVMEAYLAAGTPEVYVADLDAILQRPPQDDAVSGICARGLPVWLDAGVTSAPRARQVLGLGVATVVVGLETLESFEALDAICAAAGRHRTAFSLDLRAGTPLAPRALGAGDWTVQDLASRAAAAGAGALIVLDLARVGRGAGPDLGLLARVRRAVPHVTLLAGGGVRDADDLQRLEEAGCDGALVASALLSGQLVLPGRRT